MDGIVAKFANARRLRSDWRTGDLGQPLRGRNLALLLGTDTGHDSRALRRAAADLGARVAEVHFARTATSAGEEVGSLARMLGRLYDAIDCGALAATTFGRIELEAGVPVYDGLGLDTHPARGLADLMTLCECRPAGLAEAALLFIGDADDRRSQAFISGAWEMGFEVSARGNDPAAPDEAFFVIDATRSPHWLMHQGGRPVDEARREENHRCVIQSVLLDTMARA